MIFCTVMSLLVDEGVALTQFLDTLPISNLLLDSIIDVSDPAEHSCDSFIIFNQCHTSLGICMIIDEAA
jgi:hypothetical protein